MVPPVEDPRHRSDDCKADVEENAGDPPYDTVQTLRGRIGQRMDLSDTKY